MVLVCWYFGKTYRYKVIPISELIEFSEWIYPTVALTVEYYE